MTNEQKQPEKIKKLSLSKENPIFYKTLVVLGAVTILIQILMKGRGNIIDIIFQAFGVLVGIVLMTWIIGIIPVLIFRKKINNARINIYGVIFLLLCLLIIIGTITSN